MARKKLLFGYVWRYRKEIKEPHFFLALVSLFSPFLFGKKMFFGGQINGLVNHRQCAYSNQVVVSAKRTGRKGRKTVRKKEKEEEKEEEEERTSKKSATRHVAQDHSAVGRVQMRITAVPFPPKKTFFCSSGTPSAKRKMVLLGVTTRSSTDCGDNDGHQRAQKTHQAKKKQSNAKTFCGPISCLLYRNGREIVYQKGTVVSLSSIEI